MSKKPQYSSDDLRTITIALGIAIFILVSVMWILKLEDEKSKYTHAMNAYADLFCQDQTYEIRTFNEIIKNQSCYVTKHFENGFEHIRVTEIHNNTILPNNPIIVDCPYISNNAIEVIENRYYSTGHISSGLFGEPKITCEGNGRFNMFDIPKM